MCTLNIAGPYRPMPELVASGHALVLPRSAWDEARAAQVLRADGDRWRHVAKAVDLPLTGLIS